MNIPAKKELYGLIGYPVKHSLSPLMHNAAFAHYGINAEYQLFEILPEKLEEFFKKTILQQGIKGFNVTVPYKEKVFPYLTGEISEIARRNKAVNTVRVECDGTLSGFNTDGLGFVMDLKRQGVNVSSKKIALMGAGGGAKAIAMALAQQQIDRIFIYDVDLLRSENLVRMIKESFSSVEAQAVYSPADLKVGEADILINATPVGMKETDPLLISPEALLPSVFVYDLIYNPVETKLLKAARLMGCSCANGLGMLLYQGCLAFEHWTGKKSPVDVMHKALLEGRNHA